MRAEVLPEGKAALAARLQAEGHAVAVVGDGVNDAAALAGADLGMAVGRGTDAAIEAADVVLGRDDLLVVADAVRLARRTHATIRTNLVWAFAYNVAALPLAMAGLLSPLVAGAAMALSSVFVVSNSLRLRRFAAADGGRAPRDRSGAARWAAVVACSRAPRSSAAAALGAFAPSVGSLYGLGDLGGVVDVGLPAVRAAAIAATAVTLGQLLVAAVYVPGAPGDIVSPDGYRALRAARVTAALAARAALAATVLTVAENSAIAPGPLLARADVPTAATAVLAPAAGLGAHCGRRCSWSRAGRR